MLSSPPAQRRITFGHIEIGDRARQLLHDAIDRNWVSAGPNVDFTCFAPDGPPCRWGDYAGASPDPAATLTGSHGQVWLTDTYNVSSTNNTNVDWRTQNVGAAP